MTRITAITNVLSVTLMFYCAGCSGAVEMFAEQKNADGNVECVRKIPTTKSSTDEWKEYFDCFPGSYEPFTQLFGYQEIDGKVKYAPLYFDSHVYILDGFYKTRQYVGRKIFAEKLIRLATTATKWYPDAPSALQSVIYSELERDHETYLSILSEKNEAEIQVFWAFMFDGPHGVHLEGTHCKNRESYKACQVLIAMMRK